MCKECFDSKFFAIGFYVLSQIPQISEMLAVKIHFDVIIKCLWLDGKPQSLKN